MKYTAEEVRDYADACRLAHKDPVIADMLTELAERIEAGEAKALGTCPKHGVEYVGECSGCAMTLPEKDFTYPPAQAAGVPEGWLIEARRLYDKVKAFPEKNGGPMTVGGTGFMQLLELRNHVENLLSAAPQPGESA